MGKRTRTSHSTAIDNADEFMGLPRENRPRRRNPDNGRLDKDTDTSFWEG
jgi:hypothetical protein